MPDKLLPNDVIALNAAADSVLINWFEILNNWGWPVLLAPQGDDERRGLLIHEIERRLGTDFRYWRPDYVTWHADIPHDGRVWLLDSTAKTKEDAYVEIVLDLNRINTFRNLKLQVTIDDLQPGESPITIKMRKQNA